MTVTNTFVNTDESTLQTLTQTVGPIPGEITLWWTGNLAEFPRLTAFELTARTNGPSTNWTWMIAAITANDDPLLTQDVGAGLFPNPLRHSNPGNPSLANVNPSSTYTSFEGGLTGVWSTATFEDF